MKVNHSGSDQVQSSESLKSKNTEKANSKRNEKSSASAADSDMKALAGAKAEISPRARESAQARDVALSTPDVREDKIRELKSRIADGKYNINPQGIADHLVDEHLKSI